MKTPFLCMSRAALALFMDRVQLDGFGVIPQILHNCAHDISWLATVAAAFPADVLASCLCGEVAARAPSTIFSIGCRHGDAAAAVLVAALPPASVSLLVRAHQYRLLIDCVEASLHGTVYALCLADAAGCGCTGGAALTAVGSAIDSWNGKNVARLFAAITVAGSIAKPGVLAEEAPNFILRVLQTGAGAWTPSYFGLALLGLRNAVIRAPGDARVFEAMVSVFFIVAVCEGGNVGGAKGCGTAGCDALLVALETREFPGWSLRRALLACPEGAKRLVRLQGDLTEKEFPLLLETYGTPVLLQDSQNDSDSINTFFNTLLLRHPLPALVESLRAYTLASSG